MATYSTTSLTFDSIHDELQKRLRNVLQSDSDKLKVDSVLSRLKLASTALPTACVTLGTASGSFAAHKILTRFKFMSRYRIFYYPVPLLSIAGGTALGGVVAFKASLGAIISIGNKAVLGVVLEAVGFPEWVTNLLL